MTTDLTLSGTIPSTGATVSYRSRSDWTVENGRVVSCYAQAIPGEGGGGREALVEALVASGVQMPTPEELGFER